MAKFKNWFSTQVFSGESIKPRKVSSNLPEPIRKARELAANTYLPVSILFYDQGKILADYEPELPYNGNPVRFYPTYQSLSDDDLLGYLSLRSKMRKGDFCNVPLTFLYLYIYELINHIGNCNPQEGYEKLAAIIEKFKFDEQSHVTRLRRWLRDYAAYYNLAPGTFCLDNDPFFKHEGTVAVLDRIKEEKPEKILTIAKLMASRWLDRSRFYADYKDEMNEVIINVLKRMSDHYEKHCTRTFAEQFTGPPVYRPYRLFGEAIFANPLKIKTAACQIHPLLSYKCEQGRWSVFNKMVLPRNEKKMENIIKGIDEVMRIKFNYPHPLKAQVFPRWLQKAIEDGTDNLLEKLKLQERTRLRLDFGSLDRIRKDADIVCEKLSIEEMEELPETGLAAREIAPEVPDKAKKPDLPLEDFEIRLLHCLLYGEKLDWVKNEGLMLSVLVDAVNEKLYEFFEDSVLNDTPEVIGDYLEDLKELIPA